MRKLLISALVLALTSLPGWSQSRQWTLQECIQYALDNNITVQQSDVNVGMRQIDLNTAENSRLPSLAASSSQNFSFGRGLTADNTYANTNTTSTSFSLGGQMPVFAGLSVKHNIALGKLNLAAATADLEKAKDDIRVAVAQAYAQILFDKEILGVAQRQVQIDEGQLNRLQEMERNGKASASEVAAQEATLEQSRVSVTEASNNLSIALLDLTQLLELDSPEGFDIVSPAVESLGIGLLPNPEEIYADAVEVKPSVNAEQVRLEWAAENIALAKSAFLPSLSLSGGIGSNYYTSSGLPSPKFNEQLRNNFSQYVGLSLNIPIFNSLSTRNQVRSAQLSLRNQELQLESVKKTLYKEIQQAYYSAVASQSKFTSSAKAEESAEKEFSLMQAKYENGKAGITEFNESKARFLEAQSNLAQARYQMLYQTRLLDFYRGKEIVF